MLLEKRVTIPSPSCRIAGFTLLELIATILVLAILFLVAFKGLPFVRERAEGVKCIQNMRSLQVSLAAYLQDQGHWPQEPENLWLTDSNDAYEDWWIEVLKPYGVIEQNWQCPTVKRLVLAKTKSKRPKMHYSPTMFDNLPYTPYKWSTQPWLTEIGNMHGRGALICFPDGSIKPMNEVLGY